MTGLAEYAQDKIGKPFRWGRNDCLTFASGAVYEITGDRVYDEWLSGYTTERGAIRQYLRFVKRSGFQGIIEAIDAVFDRLQTLYPQHGALVARATEGNVLGFAFGVCVNGNILLMSDDGLVNVPPSIRDIYWRVA